MRSAMQSAWACPTGLQRRMQDKDCFNFFEVDEKLFAELVLVKRSVAACQGKNLI